MRMLSPFTDYADAALDNPAAMKAAAPGYSTDSYNNATGSIISTLSAAGNIENIPNYNDCSSYFPSDIFDGANLPRLAEHTAASAQDHGPAGDQALAPYTEAAAI